MIVLVFVVFYCHFLFLAIPCDYIIYFYCYPTIYGYYLYINLAHTDSGTKHCIMAGTHAVQSPGYC